MKKIYLSGPMKGIPENNHPLFNKVAAELRELGHTVFNPAEYVYDGKEFPLRKAFTDYCNFIVNEATAIVMLPGHEKSVGATSELALAKNFSDIEIIYYGETTL